MPEEFIAPPAGEPIPEPPPTGSTDSDLDGIDVTGEYLDEDDNLRVSAAAVAMTWAAVFTKACSYLGAYPPGRVKENVNDFTQRYYGNNTAAAWCLIFVWCMLNDFAKTAWKLAYVPWLYKIPGFHSGHSGIKPGDICAIAGYSHVGFFAADHGSEFDLVSGNSTKKLPGGGISSDAITVKRYSKSVISGYARPSYAAADPNAYPGTVYRLKSPMMHDSHVKWVQQRLGAHKHPVTVDSYFGPKTAAAVKAFQKDAKLTVDGQVGPKTWKALAA